MIEPRAIFSEGMELHEHRLPVNPAALGEVLVAHGIDQHIAMDFDVHFMPGKGALPLGVYEPNSGKPTVMTTTGEEVTLRDRVLEYHLHPNAKPPLAMAKFFLLHETGHMYRDLSGEAPDTLGYQDEAFVNRVRFAGKIGTGALVTALATFLATRGIRTEPWRTIHDDVSWAAIPAAVCSAGMTMPEGIAHLISAEEWRMHAFALRNWKAAVL